jgi:hypothetical protein
VEGPGIPELPVSDLVLTLRAVPGESKHGGVNGGAGLRVGGRVGVVGEVRVFYFPEYAVALSRARTAGSILDELIGGLSPGPIQADLRDTRRRA